MRRAEEFHRELLCQAMCPYTAVKRTKLLAMEYDVSSDDIENTMLVSLISSLSSKTRNGIGMERLTDPV